MKVNHTGHHNHPAPEPIHATEKGKRWIKNVVSVHPDITTTGLKLDKGPRPSARHVDPAFQKDGYLKHVPRSARSNAAICLMGCKTGMDNIDISNEYIRQLKAKYSVMWVGSALSGLSNADIEHGPAYIIQSLSETRIFG